MSNQGRKYYSENKETVQKRQRKWAESEKGKLSNRERSKRYSNTEKGKEYRKHLNDSGYFEEYRKRYYLENSDKFYVYNVKRRSYKHKVQFTPVQRKTILDRDNWTCQCCGIKVHDDKVNNSTKAHIDHVVPISRGGNSEPSNLQILCRTCNLTKKDKLLV